MADKKAESSGSGFYIFKTLRIPSFAPLQASRLCSFCASTMEVTVTGWLVLETTNNALLVASAGTFRMLPALIFGLFSGVVADKVDRRRLLQFTQLGEAVLALLMWVLVASGGIQFWHVALIVFLLGTLSAFDWPARMAMITDVVGLNMTFSGVAVDNLSGYLMMILGPIVGGWIIGFAGTSWCYLVLGVLYVVGAFAILRVRTPKKSVSPGVESESAARGLVAGFAYIKTRPTIIGVLAITVIMNIFGFTYSQLLPVFARDVLYISPEGYGLLVGATGFGAAGTALFIAFRGGVKRVEVVFSLATLLLAGITVAFSLSRWYELSLVLRVLAGVGQAYFEIGQYGLPLAHSSDEMRGRVMAILNLTMQGMFPIGTTEIGAVASSSGAGYATLVNGCAALVLCAGTIMLIPSLRRKK